MKLPTVMKYRSAASLPQSLQRLFRQFSNFVFPAECALCGDRDHNSFGEDYSGNSAYCIVCREKLVPDISCACSRCGAALGEFSKTTEGCVHCRGRKLAFDSVICMGMYKDELKQAMLGAKWSWSSVSMESLAELFWEKRGASLRSLNIDRIVPMPQHWHQRLVRHFNPAGIVAELLGRRLSVPCDPHILCRRRRTRPQKRVAVSQRFENQKDAFRLRDAFVVRGERILIVDDVLTTGATCSEAARLLNSAGATRCHVGVISRVLDHSA